MNLIKRILKQSYVFSCVKRRVCISISFLLLICFQAYSHGTQVGYCITTSGAIRVYIEHWHGDISPAAVTNALVVINVTDSSTGMTTTSMSIPNGVVWNTAVGSLPDCKGPMNVVSSCPGRANVYNDWVYWDFLPPSCFVNLEIEVAEVVGSDSWYFDEACTELYPVTFVDSFIDCVPPNITCPSDITSEVNTTDCEANLTGLEPEILFDDCTALEDIILTYDITGATTRSGSGPADGIFEKGVSRVTYSAEDESGKISMCSFLVTIEDTTRPAITCPSSLNLSCDDPAYATLISDWLDSVTASDFCGILDITNDYDPDGFVFTTPEDPTKYISPSTSISTGSYALSHLVSKNLFVIDNKCEHEISFQIEEVSGQNIFDYPLKARVNFENLLKYDHQFMITDSDDRIVPFIVDRQEEEYLDIWMKIPALKAGESNEFKFQYGSCESISYNFEDIFSEENTPENAIRYQKTPKIEGALISTKPFYAKPEPSISEQGGARMMDCNCTVTQGTQSFPINAIKNAEDDVSFFSYGTPNGASANTGLEMNDAVVLFLYENTLTGEISLFILIDDAGGGNGGAGSVDFFCLPTTATLDFSDDPGEISGIFPTVTANWRWANCCTDGALIGNMECGSTFDFYPDFTSGINDIKWASGTLAAPTFTSFGSLEEPVRITCGMSMPSCCPNANTVTSTNASCPSSTDGSVDVVPDASGGPYDFIWSNGATTEDLNDIAAGDYTVTITDALDCEQIIDVTVEVENEPTLVCPAIITIDYEGDMATVELDDLMYTINYDCPDDVKVDCVGCGEFDCDDQNTSTNVTITGTDEVGNSDACTISVFLRNSSPEITCPVDLNIDCLEEDKEGLINDWLTTVSSSADDLQSISNDYDEDGFTLVTLIDEDDLMGSQSGKQSIHSPQDFYFVVGAKLPPPPVPMKGSQVVTFTATDVCGNTSTCTASIIITDSTPPEITCPTDLTIECGQANNDAIIQLWLESVSATDSCSDEVTITNNFVDTFTGGCGDTGTRTVTFTADDGCGNTSSCTATITMEDSLAPEFLMKPQDSNGECINSLGATGLRNAWLSSNGGGMAVDDCDANVTWTTTLESRTEECGYTWSETYVFTITDDCGNSATAAATFTVEDTDPPTLNVPADRTVNCATNNETTLENQLNLATAVDDCTLNADIDIEYQLYNTINGCGNSSTRIYLFRATDECGNQTTDFYSFTIQDIVDPTWVDLPGTLVLECGDEDNPVLIEAWLEDVEDAMTDACGGEVFLTHNWDGNLNEGCNQNTTITFTVEDECGNSRTLNRVIAVRDTEVPIFLNCPTDMTVNVDIDVCEANVVFSTPIAHDNCTEPLVVTQTIGLVSGSPFPVGNTLIRFETSDECNRRALCQFTITVVDTDTPSLDCPSNVEACTAAGACTWTADDSVLFIGVDNCGIRTTQYSIEGATELSRRSGTAEGRPFNIGTSTVCYYVTDTEGNETSCCFDVIVSDCEDPSITCPEDITVECDAAGNAADLAAWIAMVSGADNCDIDEIISNPYNNISDCGESETIIYEFQAIDEAGNVTTCFSSFTIEDTTVPVIETGASDGVSNCDEADSDLLDWLNSNGGAEASDICGDITWTNDFGDGASTGCSGVTSLSVVFTATDACGNTSTTSADFNVDDNIEPEITCPENITLSCGNPANDAIIDLWVLSATATDNCTNPVITSTYPDEYSPDCAGAGIYEISFTAEDDCGNTSECVATISIEDEIPPSFIMKPQTLIVECDGDGNNGEIKAWLTDNGNAMAEDDCDSDLTWDFEELSSTTDCGETTDYIFTFIVTDACGNSSTANGMVQIEDTVGPIITAPDDLTIACDGADPSASVDAWIATATATDLCGDVTIAAELYNSISGCGETYSETYLFVATDDCGNQTTEIATIVIEDSTPPTLTCPDDLTIECGALENATIITAWLNEVTAADNCGNVTFSNNYTGLLPANCGGSITITFTGVDDCGNTNTCAADIIMQDVTIPDFVNCPEDITINVDTDECGSNPIFSTPIAVDNCDVTVTQTAGPASGTSFPLGESTVEFTATDACGNTNTCEFTITVVDSDVPLILCPSTTIEVCADEGTCLWTSTDIGPSLGLENCPDYSISYSVTGVSSGTGADDASGTIFNIGTSTVCYTVEDSSGNTSSCCFNIIVSDCEAPVINCPADLTVECAETSSTPGSSGILRWNHNSAGGTSYAAENAIPSVVSSANDINFGMGLTLLDGSANPTTIPNGTNYEHVLTGVTTNTFAAAKAADDYVETCFTTGAAGTLTQIQQGIVPTAWGGSAAGSFKVAAEISSDGFTTNTLLYSNAQISDPNATGNYALYQESLAFPLVAGQTYKIRYYLYDEQNNANLADGTPLPDNTVAFDDLELTIQEGPMLTGNGAQLQDWLASVTATDNCEDSPIISNILFNDISSCGNSQIWVYEFTAIDYYGNSTVCQATFTIEDNTPPNIDVFASNLTVECDESSSDDLLGWLNNAGGASATDICGGVQWSNNYTSSLTDGCGDTGEVFVVFVATDDCGNTATTSASFRVEDTVAPEINCPLPIILECGDLANDAIIANWLTTVSGEDECGNVSFTNNYPSGFVPTCGDAGVYTVTFTAIDDCGNTNTCTSEIILLDRLNPVFDVQPDDLVIECASDDYASLYSAWLASNGNGIASDLCGEITWLIESQDELGGCGENSNIPHLFTVTDACGNSSTAIANVITEDTTSPELTLPTDLVVECDGAGNIAEKNAWLETVSATDLCGEITTAFVLENSISACGDSNTEVYLFIATDECGNESTGLASFTIEDTVSPEIICPEDLMLECGAAGNDLEIVAWLSSAEGSDICGSVRVVNNYTGLIPEDCDGSLEITFTAVDDCGNTTSCTAMILMDDTTEPSFINCPPEDLTINVDIDECGANPIFSTPIAEDNCMVTVTQTAGPISGSEFELGTNAVEFTATDGCGNTALCQFNIIVVDSDEPTILCPSSTVQACVDLGSCSWTSVDIAPSLGVENCPDYTIDYTITGATVSDGTDDASGEVFELGSSMVCYTITDSSGNNSVCCFNVMVTDCENPSISCSDELNVACGMEDVEAWQESIAATITDNCSAAEDMSIDITLITDFSSCGNTFEQSYLFTVTDEAGNMATCIATYETDDEVNPVIDVDAQDLTLECDGSSQSVALQAWLNNNGGAVATDVCSEPVTWSNNFTGGTIESCDPTGGVEVIFTATDDCGNTSTTSAIFTIDDTTAPELFCPSNITLECSDEVNEAIIESWLTDVSAIDACESSLAVTNNYADVFVDACGETGVYTITFTVTDACANVSTCDRTITLVDTTNPTIEIEAQDLTLECADADNAVLIETWENTQGGAVASDACSDEALIWEIIEEIEISGCGDLTTTLYVFEVTDNCGNTNTTSASIIVEDTTPPVLILPEDQVEECGAIVVDLVTWQGEAMASDLCGEVTIDVILWNTISGCGGTETEIYLFTATDECGNETTGLANYETEDSISPEITCPEDLALTCGNENNDQLIAAWLKMAVSTDVNDCSETTISYSMPGGLPMPLDCADGEGIDVTFTATDACGNTSTCVATITMDDEEAPYFSNCPTNLTVNVDVDLCESNVVYSTPIALDNCDGMVTVTLEEGPASGTAFELGTTTVTFLATDHCGNTSTCSFDITVIDSDVPSIDCPSNQVVVCADEGTCTWVSDEQTDPLFNDNCPGLELRYEIEGATTANGDETVAGDGIVFNLGSSIVTYIIKDPAGNESSCSFVVVVEDCENPTISCSDELNVACGMEDVEAWQESIAATITDNCSAAEDMSIDITLITDFSSCGNTFEQTYLFRVTDEAGNTATCIATYETDDEVNPVIDIEAENLTLECDGSTQSTALQAWLNNNGGAEASDDCSGPVVWSNNLIDDLITSCGPNGSIEVIFTATDDCGNASTTSATFTIEDTTAPEIICPDNITLECSDPINESIITSWLTDVSSVDACQSSIVVENNYADIFSDACGLTGTYTVTFTATDDCGNVSTCDRTITLIDTTKPTITAEATDFILECTDSDLDLNIEAFETGFAGADATDQCSDEDLIWEIQSQINFTECGTTFRTLYVFRVIDNCGNYSTTSASIIVEDRTAPELTVPEEQIVECGDIDVVLVDWIEEATATDACGEVSIDAILWNTTSGCGGSEEQTYLFTATDECGNETTGLSKYIIEDTTSPEIICPGDLPLICGNENNDQIIAAWLASATSQDAFDCSDTEVTYSMPGGQPNPLDCAASEGIEVTFTATDACGNTSICTATITMDDGEAPYFSNCPTNLTVNVDVDLCETNVVYSTPVALDNCDEDVNVSLIEGPASGTAFELGTTTVTFLATDDCGNTSTCSFDITVIDSDVPSVSCPSNEVIVCTDENTCTWLSDDRTDPLFNDNCDGLELSYEITGATNEVSAAAGVNTIQEDGIVFNLGTSFITYTITDPTGNVSSCSFRVIVEDCQNPEITCSDLLDIACGAEDVMAWQESIASTITDNCSDLSDLMVDVRLITDFSSCGNTFEQTYLFRVTDEAGNTATCIATYETDDDVAPVIEVEAENLTLECNGGNQSTALQAWLNNNAGAEASDACSGPVIWSNDFIGDLNNTCGTNGEVNVIFTATDDCGNTSTTMAVFTIEDTTSPILDCPENITLDCTGIINDAVIESWLSDVSSIDACEGALSVTNNYAEVFEDGCGETGVYTVTFSTEDACGNPSSCNRTITLVDNTAPRIERQPEDLILECDVSTNAATIATWENSYGGSLASDECSDEPLIWEILEEIEIFNCGLTGEVRYTFQVTDNCGNTSTTSASVITFDTTAPILNLPEAQVEECAQIEVTIEEWLAEVSATDDCGTVTITADLWDSSNDCGNNTTEVYLFIATDNCGNQTTGFSEYQTVDTTVPVITEAADDFIAECNGSSNAAEILAWLNSNGGAAAIDLCGNISWSNNYGDILSDCGTTGEVEVTFTATDDCGNSSTTSAIFEINDTTAPVWEILPQNLEIECDGTDDPMGQIIAWLNTAGGADVEDDCSFVVFTNNFENIDLECDQQGGVEVTFVASDACGNNSSATALLSITDDVPPVITTPAKEEIVECDGNGNLDELQAWLDNHGGAEAADACSASLTWNYTLMNTEGQCGNTLIQNYMFTATDACDNVSINTVAQFIIEDTTSPEIGGITNTVVECDGNGNDAELQAWLEDNGGLFATDDCSENFEWEYDLISFEENCGITNVSTYRFTVIDECGNSSFDEATFTIEDTSNPIIVGGEDMAMEECDEPPLGNFPDFDFWLDNNAGATASDNCGEIQWINNYNPANWVFTCGNTRYIDVLFTAIDDCGNLSTIEHRFGVGDVTPPEFTNCPRPPVIVNAPDQWCSAYANFELPTAEDNCGGLVVITRQDDTDLNSGDLFPVGTTILTYVAEDECGNTSYCELKIIVNDFHTEPTIECPDDIDAFTDTEICGNYIDNLAPSAIEENCPDNLSVIYEIVAENDQVVSAGVLDASGSYFPQGSNTVNYAAIDQPILLITEVIQNDLVTGVEITNFGPANLDISCLDIVREQPVTERHNVPNGTVLAPGDVYYHYFTNIPSGTSAGYYIEFVGRVIDGVSVNGYSGLNYDFNGSIFGEDFYRLYVWDHDGQVDFEVADPCLPGSFESLNPDLPIFPSNGTTVGLQEGEAGVSYCSSTVNIIDNIAPFCAEFDTSFYKINAPVEILDGCTQIHFTVDDDMSVGDVHLMDLSFSFTNIEDLIASLTSPTGTSVTLFAGSCTGSSSVSVSFDDDAGTQMGSVLCDPPGGGQMYAPMESFKTFFNESAQGTWMLEIEDKGIDEGFVFEATLEILTLVPFTQEDMVLEVEEGECGANYTWQHPMFSDNCCFGGMTFESESPDGAEPPLAFGDFAQGSFTGGMFGVGTTTIIYTSTDQFGNESICSFDVTVVDNIAPVFAPADCEDRYFQLSSSNCAIPMSALELDLNSLRDNCGDITYTIAPDYPDGIPAGEHTFTVVMTDAAGNTAECEFDVLVEFAGGAESGDAIVCVGNVNLGLGPDCMAEITPEMVLADPESYGCTEDFCVTLTDQFGNEIGTSEEGTNIVTEDHIGQQIVVEICIDCEDSNCCWAYMTVENKLIPEVICPPDIEISCNQTFDTSITGMPEVQTCEQEIYFNYDDELIDMGMCEDPAAMIIRTWFITDESNNTITCEQTITIMDFNLEDVVIPDDVILTDTYTCDEIAADPSLTHPDETGYPLIGGVPIWNTGDGLCSHFWNYDDLILNNCEGSYEILRRWVIHDMCEDQEHLENPIERYQFIKVFDDIPPVFENCPGDVTINAGTINCEADIYLNEFMPTIFDECGAVQELFVTVNPGTVYETAEGSGEYYLTNLVPGEHRVKIRARDQCSNSSTCEFNIYVEDLQEPNAICEGNIVVSLSNTGNSKLYAEVLDDGSFDYCTDVDFQIYRLESYCYDEMDLEPGPYITLCCEDVDQGPFMVALRVWDDADYDGEFGTLGDHYTECMVQVTVQDKSIPELQCPPDVTLQCGQDFTNLDLTGNPAVGFVCNTIEAEYIDDLTHLEECNVGYVIRKWTVPTVTGDVQCDQIITIFAPDVFTESDIIWAADWEGDCNDSQPDGRPQFIGEGVCDQLGVSLESDTFQFVEDACFKIINHWTVRNWCKDEEYTDTQVIKIIDDSPPIIQVNDADFVAIGNNCESTINLSAAADDSGSSCPSESICWNIYVDLDDDGTDDYQFSGLVITTDTDFDDTDGDGVPDVYVGKTSPGEMVEISIPEAISVSTDLHKVTWTAIDGCGNSASSISYFEVQDSKPPTAACLNLSTGVMVNGEVTLWACDFDASSSDNCTAIDDLLFGFTDLDPTLDPTFNPISGCTSKTFTCDDYNASNNGVVSVDIYVWDEFGNFSICQAQLTLIDQTNSCDGNFAPMIAGRIGTAQGEGITAAEVSLDVIGGDPMGDLMTDELGSYSFEDILLGDSYKLEVAKDTLDKNGVSTLDIIQIQKYVLGLQEFESPYQLIAADINGDERVSSLDIVTLRKLILGVHETFPDNESWRFVDGEAVLFMDNVWPFDEDIKLFDVDHSEMQNDFVGVKIGDVNFTATPNLLRAVSEVRGDDKVNWSFNNKDFGVGQELVVELTAATPIELEGFQFTLEHTGLKLTKLTVEGAYWEDDYFASANELTSVSWNDPELKPWNPEAKLQFHFIAEIDGSLEDVLDLNSKITFAEAYNPYGQEVIGNGLEMFKPVFKLAQNNPNPFIDRTQIEFSIPSKGMVEFLVHDSSGKLLFKSLSEYEEGRNILMLSGSDLGIYKGMTTVTMKYGMESQSIKMIRVD